MVNPQQGKTQSQVKTEQLPSSEEPTEEPRIFSVPPYFKTQPKLAAIDPEKENRDPSEWMFDRQKFQELDREYGPFTLDVAANPSGDNAQCNRFCSKESSFFEQNLSGETVWANFPYEQAGDFLDHYFTAKAGNPSIAAAIVLPEWTTAPWWQRVSHLRRIGQYPRGTDLFTAAGPRGERTALGPTRWPVIVFWDPATAEAPPTAEQDARLEDCSLYSQASSGSTAGVRDTQVADKAAQKPSCRSRLLIVEGQVNTRHGKKPATVLIDGGAGINAISEQFAQAHGINLRQGKQCRISLAGGQQQDASNKATVQVSMQGYASRLELRATSLEGWDVLLGKPWLTDNNPSIDWKKNTVELYREGRKIVINASRKARKKASKRRKAGVLQRNQKQAECCVEQCTPTQVKRLVKNKDNKVFVGFISSSEEAQTSIASVEPHALGDALEQLHSGAAENNLEAARYEHVVSDFSDVFQDPTGRPPERHIEHRIQLETESNPPFRPVLRLSPAELEESRKQIADFIKRTHVRPSKSPYSAPVIFVRKPNGTLRMCIDYRALNKLTIKDRYPMPRIEELLDQLLGATVFTKLDLASGYHQVRVAEEDVEKTAFRTRDGHYEFTVMPFGLCNAPATFQRLMNDVLRPFIDKFAVVYMDDILIYSQDAQQHEEHMRQVLQVLREQKLFCRKEKCSFGMGEVEYLGHTAGPKGVRMDDRKVEAIQHWPTPTGKKDLRSFLGLACYYRRFIEKCAHRVAPMSELLKQENQWAWEAPQENAFADIKQAMTTAPVLALPDPALPYEVYTDASGF